MTCSLVNLPDLFLDNLDLLLICLGLHNLLLFARLFKQQVECHFEVVSQFLKFTHGQFFTHQQLRLLFDSLTITLRLRRLVLTIEKAWFILCRIVPQILKAVTDRAAKLLKFSLLDLEFFNSLLHYFFLLFKTTF
jgi:hypothetical protein